MKTADKLQIADRNFKKFHEWLHKTFKGNGVFERAYARQIGDQYQINLVWQYGSLKDSRTVATIPLYDMFDPDFDPETFYKIELPA